MSEILVPSNASSLYLSAITQIIKAHKRQLVTISVLSDKKPLKLTDLGDWVDVLRALPSGLYALTEF